jgi:hypothetical protein
MRQFVMQPGMVYQYPIWWVALLLVGLSTLGAVLLELAVHQFLSIELAAVTMTSQQRYFRSSE